MPDYLLDVNVFVAHAVLEHVHYRQVTEWLARAGRKGCVLHVCPIVELGLVRNVMRIGALSIGDARQLLENEYANLRLRRIPDSVSAAELPDWIQVYRQTTDAYLNQLAKAHQLVLLTIDKGIPGSLQILRASD